MMAQEVELEQGDDLSDVDDKVEGAPREDDTLTAARAEIKPPFGDDPEMALPTGRYSGSLYVDSPLPDDSPTESGVMHDGLSQESMRAEERVSVASVDRELQEQPEDDADAGNVEDFWVPSMTQDGQVNAFASA